MDNREIEEVTTEEISELIRNIKDGEILHIEFDPPLGKGEDDE